MRHFDIDDLMNVFNIKISIVGSFNMFFFTKFSVLLIIIKSMVVNCLV